MLTPLERRASRAVASCGGPLLASCGHETPRPKGYKGRAKDHPGLCPDCYRAQQDRDTLQFSRSVGLCLLSGTDRQVAWAYKLRLTALLDATARITTRGWSTTRDAVLMHELAECCNRHRNAGWWIGHRRYAAEEILASCDYGASGEPLYEPAPF